MLIGTYNHQTLRANNVTPEKATKSETEALGETIDHINLLGSHLILNEAGGVLQHQLVFAHALVSGGESQTAQSVPSTSIFPDHRQYFFLDARGQGHLVTAYTDVCAPVNHSLRGTL